MRGRIGKQNRSPEWARRSRAGAGWRLSNSLTAVVVPDGADSDAVLRAAERLNPSLGTGLGRLKGKAFRIGHLGALNELEVLATMAGTELACTLAGIRIPVGAGVAACEHFFAEHLSAARAGRR